MLGVIYCVLRTQSSIPPPPNTLFGRGILDVLMENKKKNNAAANKKKEKIFKNVFLVVITLLLLFLTFGSKITSLSQTKVDYNTFLDQVADGTVKTADINTSSGKVVYTITDSNKTFYTNYPYSEDFSEMLLINNVEIKIHETNWLFTVLKYAATPILLCAFMYFTFASNLIGGDFSVEAVSNNKTTFNDVAGMDEIKEDMLVLSEMMKNESYKKSGARIPRGVLLQGPPGNGKTLLARAFAGETGVNFIAVNACDFGSQFVGIGSTKIKKVFAAAKKNAPCVIFIDELDAVGSKRGFSQDAAGKEMNTMLTALLNQMDGFEPMDNVMVLAATNRVEDLDDALVRPGRFDRQFIVNYPDKTTRKQIFKKYTKDSLIDESVDFDKLASRTYGYSSSKIECIVNEAVINSVKENRNFLVLDDFENAILQMDLKGKLKKNPAQNERVRETVAYHEAGHAVVAYFAGNKKVISVSIIPTTSGAGGFTQTDESGEELRPIDDYRKEIMMLYGGRAAEAVLRGGVEQASTGAVSDIHEATKIAASYVNFENGIDYSAFGESGRDEIMNMSKKLLADTWNDSYKLVKDKWTYVEKVAKKLLEDESIAGDLFEKIMNKV